MTRFSTTERGSGRRRLAIAAMSVAVLAGALVLRHQRPTAPTAARAHSSATAALAPQFSLKGLNGEQVSLSDYRGKVVLIDFWATWCAPCKIEIPKLVKLQKKYAGEGLQVIGISMDDGPEPVRGFARDFAINYPVAMGDVKVAEAYGGILGLPVAFLIDREGHIYRKMVGDAEMEQVESDVRSLLESR
jgi:cytochrome c biogenesis protein CcmG, thiol:disulfide interchange protein DsbE